MMLPPGIAAERVLRPAALTRRVLAGDPALPYFLYVPRRGGADAPIVVAVHGVSRNAGTQVAHLAAGAERHGAVLVAPLFGRESFRGYQRLGRGRGQAPADRALLAVIDEVAGLVGARGDAVRLFGHSGGGQFAHRFAMVWPERVHAVAAGAPGWFTFPRADLDYPYGLAGAPEGEHGAPDPRRFLRVPTAVLVGARDRSRSRPLNTHPLIDAEQGRDRVERAGRWVSSMRAAARDLGYDTAIDLRVLEGCAHSFSQCAREGNLAGHVLDFLFRGAAAPSGRPEAPGGPLSPPPGAEAVAALHPLHGRAVGRRERVDQRRHRVVQAGR